MRGSYEIFTELHLRYGAQDVVNQVRARARASGRDGESRVRREADWVSVDEGLVAKTMMRVAAGSSWAWWPRWEEEGGGSIATTTSFLTFETVSPFRSASRRFSVTVCSQRPLLSVRGILWNYNHQAKAEGDAITNVLSLYPVYDYMGQTIWSAAYSAATAPVKLRRIPPQVHNLPAVR
jgi:hypothetical protein